MKKAAVFALMFLTVVILQAQESWLLPIDSPLYREAEELFLCQGVVPPYEELPLAAEELRERLRALAQKAGDEEQVKVLNAMIDRIVLPFPVVSPIIETALSGFYNSEPGRFSNVILYDGRSPDLSNSNNHDSLDNGLPIYDYTPFYEANNMPSLLKAGVIIHFLGFALLFQPELRQTHYGLLSDGTFATLPFDFSRFDVANTPLVGLLNFYSPNFEARVGRGPLHSGPGKWSSLSLSRTMPYFDHARVRFRYEGFSLTTTIVTLNPDISSMESGYLDYLYDNNLNPEANGGTNGRIFRERIKNYINVNCTIRPWDWLSFTFMQTNLVGGRPIDIADFNPLNIFHNNFDDGSYSVPVLLSATVVPFKGVKVYAEFLFYDAAAGDEVLYPDSNPGAIALQGGFSLLSTPYFNFGPGRFRLDFEATYVDPYCYGKFYDLRTFTSRFTYIDPGPGRYWVDYPLGFYLGPDCLDFHAVLNYGQPGVWEIGLEWQTTGRGEVDLYGYGDDANYTPPRSASGAAPTGTAEWRHSIGANFFIEIIKNLTLDCWYRLIFVNNRFNPALRQNIAGDNQVFHALGLAVKWKIF
jgi:hypothetical protein